MEHKKENQQRWYQKNKVQHQKNVHRRKYEVKAENRLKILEHFKSHPCVDCGVTDPDMLTFDHVTGQKKMEVSTLVIDGYSWTTIQKEIDKCVVRCWNHHMKRTAEERRAKVRVRSSVGRAGAS